MEDTIRKQLQSRLQKAKEGIESTDPTSVAAGTASGYFAGKAAQKYGDIQERKAMKRAIETTQQEATALADYMPIKSLDPDRNAYTVKMLRDKIRKRAEIMQAIDEAVHQKGYLPTDEAMRMTRRATAELSGAAKDAKIEFGSSVGDRNLRRINEIKDIIKWNLDDTADINRELREKTKKLKFLRKAPIVGAAIGAGISAATGYPEEIFDPAAYSPLGPSSVTGDDSPERIAIEEPIHPQETVMNPELAKERLRREMLKRKLMRLRNE